MSLTRGSLDTSCSRHPVGGKLQRLLELNFLTREVVTAKFVTQLVKIIKRIFSVLSEKCFSIIIKHRILHHFSINHFSINGPLLYLEYTSIVTDWKTSKTLNKRLTLKHDIKMKF